MRLVAVTLAAALCATTGCGQSIGTINARPERYYQKKVSFDGRLARRQDLPGETLLEVTDRRGARILVRAPAGVGAVTGDWVSVKGVLVPEARVGQTTLYDVVAADKVSKRSPPRIPDLM
jgi:hypothetical protein